MRHLGPGVQASHSCTVHIAGDEADAQLARLGHHLQPLYEEAPLVTVAVRIPTMAMHTVYDQLAFSWLHAEVDAALSACVIGCWLGQSAHQWSVRSSSRSVCPNLQALCI